MTKIYAIKRLETIVKHSEGGNYHYEVVANDWEGYGKNRTYLSIIETRDNSKHHVERKYGYIDNISGEYVPGKNNLEENFTFSGSRFETSEGKQFATKEEFTEWIQEHQDRSLEANLNGTQYPTDDEFLRLLADDGYTEFDNLTANGQGYAFCGYTNNGWLWEDEADLAYIKRTGRKTEVKKKDKTPYKEP